MATFDDGYGTKVNISDEGIANAAANVGKEVSIGNGYYGVMDANGNMSIRNDGNYYATASGFTPAPAPAPAPAATATPSTAPTVSDQPANTIKGTSNNTYSKKNTGTQTPTITPAPASTPTSTGTPEAYATATEDIYQGAAGTPNAKKHWNEAGDKFITNVKDANGNIVPGYIDANGVGHLENGALLPNGYSIETEHNGWYTPGQDTGAFKTTYTDSRGHTHDAYIIGGKTYTDPNGTQEVPYGVYVTDQVGRVWWNGNGNQTMLISSPYEEDHYNPNDHLNDGFREEFTDPDTGKTAYVVYDAGKGVYYVENADHHQLGYITGDGVYHSAYPEEDQNIANAAKNILQGKGVEFNGLSYAKLANGADRSLDYITGLNQFADEIAAGRDGAEALKKMGFMYDQNGKVVPIPKSDGQAPASSDILNTVNTIIQENGNVDIASTYTPTDLSGIQRQSNSAQTVNVVENSPRAVDTSRISRQANNVDMSGLNTILEQIEQSGVDTDALRDRINTLYAEGNYDEIKELLNESIVENLDLQYGVSDTFKEAYDAFLDTLNQKVELNFDEPNRNTEAYSPTDYTTQINEIYDKGFQAAKTQIENQLAMGELDIDQAIEKVPQIYESGMNDMAQQYEMNKRNANEYFNANGLSSGARAQALLAMNNVYQQNMNAYKLEEANAIQEYENQRTKLRLEAQGAITEALLQNDQSRASALLAEFQRQDEYNFKFLLQKMDDDYKYYALDVDKAIKKAAFEEQQRQDDMAAYQNVMNIEEQIRDRNNTLRMQEAELLEKERQLVVSTKLDIAKLEEEARQKGINTELTLAEMAQKDSQFKISANMDVQSLIEKMREFGISTDISLAELAEKAREFGINANLQQAELNEKIRQNQINTDLAIAELTEKMNEFGINSKMTEAQFNESVREFALKYGLDVQKFEEEAKEAWETIQLNKDKLAEDKRQFDATLAAKGTKGTTGNPNYTPSDDGGGGGNGMDTYAKRTQNSGYIKAVDNAVTIANNTKNGLSYDDNGIHDMLQAIADTYGVDYDTIKSDYDTRNYGARNDPKYYSDLVDLYYEANHSGLSDSAVGKLVSNLASKYNYSPETIIYDLNLIG